MTGVGWAVGEMTGGGGQGGWWAGCLQPAGRTMLCKVVKPFTKAQSGTSAIESKWYPHVRPSEHEHLTEGDQER